jgi:hypothetical protein
MSMRKPTAQIFTPCAATGSLLIAMTEAAKRAVFGNAPLLSPACSSFDQPRNGQQSGKTLGRMVKSTGRGAMGRGPYIHGECAHDLHADPIRSTQRAFVSEFLEGELRTRRINHSPMKGRDSRQQHE